MTADEISKKACEDVVEMLDPLTLQHRISLAETARIYREVATECLERANGLAIEAEAAGEEGDA